MTPRPARARGLERVLSGGVGRGVLDQHVERRRQRVGESGMHGSAGDRRSGTAASNWADELQVVSLVDRPGQNSANPAGNAGDAYVDYGLRIRVSGSAPRSLVQPCARRPGSRRRRGDAGGRRLDLVEICRRELDAAAPMTRTSRDG
jgi:hypothetical protein